MKQQQQVKSGKKKWKIDAWITESANVSQFFSKRVRSWPMVVARK